MIPCPMAILLSLQPVESKIFHQQIIYLKFSLLKFNWSLSNWSWPNSSLPTKQNQKETYPDWLSRQISGIRASDPQPPSLNCLGLVVHSLDPPESQIQIQNFPIQNPKSKLFDRGLDFDFGPLCSTLTQILDFGFWIWVLDSGFWVLDFGFWILDFRLWILDLGFWILQFGVLCSSSFCADFGFWNLDFELWILVHVLDLT